MTDCWFGLKDALNDQVHSLKRATYLCVEDCSKLEFVKDLSGLDATVKALEQQVSELKERIAREKETIPKVEALIQACRLQDEDIQRVASNLPTHLPSRPASNQLVQQPQSTGISQPSTAGQHNSDIMHRDTGKQQPYAEGHCKARPGAAQTAAGAGGGAGTARPASLIASGPAPRWFVTEAELNSVASYMRGRLTQDKINAALEELAGCADGNVKLLTQARSQGSRMGTGDRKRATELLHSVAGRDDVRGRHWFLEADLREGCAHIKLDKSGKSLLTVLRHLGRLAEVRCTIEGAPNIIYIMQPGC